MQVKQLVELIEGTVFTKKTYCSDKEVNFAFSCDLMSDALMLLRNVTAEFCEQGVLVTGLVTVQAVRTTEMLDMEVIVFARGKIPTQAVIEAAEKLGIMMIGTKMTMFSTSGRMYQAGIKGVSDLG